MMPNTQDSVDVVATDDDAAPGPSDRPAEAPTVAAPRKPRAARRLPTSDVVLEGASDRARAGLLDVVPESQVGRHVSATIDGERLVTHRFEAFVPGYTGWQWYVSVARVARSKDVTVCEVGLLPSEASLTAPEWLPWSERVRPEDSETEDAATSTADPVEEPAAADAPVGIVGDPAESEEEPAEVVVDPAEGPTDDLTEDPTDDPTEHPTEHPDRTTDG